ncbi:MAG: phage integrase SAM-like domain-containing protein [Saprospiraceae bacterium]
MPRINGTPKVRFNLWDKREELTYVFAYFHYEGGQRLKYSTGYKVRPEFWDGKTHRLKLNRKYPEHTDINLHLNKMELTITQIYRDFDNGEILPEDFRKEMDYRLGYAKRPENKAVKAPTLFSFIQTFIDEKKVQPRGTWKILQTVFWLLKSYAEERTGGQLSYENIDFAFFSDFKAWLFAAPREHSANYAAKVVSVLRQFLRDAQRRGYHSKTDFQNFTVKKVKTTKIALSFEELETMYKMDLGDNQRLERVRDLFLIGAYTGLRFSDFTRIRPELIEAVNGESILSITTQKTGEQVSIPLLPIPLALLRKYNFEAPKISNQKMNDYLKELGQLAGMTGKMIVIGSKGGKREDLTAEKWEKLTTHVARRSFATNFYRAGIQPGVLMKITGHSTERQFMQYIAIDGKENAQHFADLHKLQTDLKQTDAPTLTAPVTT